MEIIISIIIFCVTFLGLYLLFKKEEKQEKQEKFETVQVNNTVPVSTQSTNTIQGLIDVGCWKDNENIVVAYRNNNNRTIAPIPINMRINTPQQIWNNEFSMKIEITVPSYLLTNYNINDWNNWALTILNKYGFDTIGYQNNDELYIGKYNASLYISYSNRNKTSEFYNYKYDYKGMSYDSCSTFGGPWVNHVFLLSSTVYNTSEIFIGLQGTCRTANNLYPPWKAINNTTFNNCKTTCLNDNKCSGYGFAPSIVGSLIRLDTVGNCQLFDISNAPNKGTAVSGTLLTKGDGSTLWNCFIAEKRTTPTTTTTTKPPITTTPEPTEPEQVFTGLKGQCRTADNKYPSIKASRVPGTFINCRVGCMNDSICSGYAFSPSTPGAPIKYSTVGMCQQYDSSSAVIAPSTVGNAPSRTRLTKGDGSDGWTCFLTSKNPN
jgi:hypothetical protein